jgi:hypothetical protein
LWFCLRRGSRGFRESKVCWTLSVEQPRASTSFRAAVRPDTYKRAITLHANIGRFSHDKSLWSSFKTAQRIPSFCCVTPLHVWSNFMCYSFEAAGRRSLIFGYMRRCVCRRKQKALGDTGLGIGRLCGGAGLVRPRW